MNCRCDERLKATAEGSTRLPYTKIESQTKKMLEKKISKGQDNRTMQPLMGQRKSSGAGKVAATIAVGVALVLAGMSTSK